MQPGADRIAGWRAAELLLRVIPNIIEHGMKNILEQLVHPNTRNGDETVVVLIKELPAIGRGDLADTLALPSFVQRPIAVRGVPKHLFDFFATIWCFHCFLSIFNGTSSGKKLRANNV